MSRISASNGFGVALALILAFWLSGAASRGDVPARIDDDASTIDVGAMPRQVIVDASETAIPIRDYRRILSASTIADELLLELAAPDRILAFTAQSSLHPTRGHRYAGKAAVEDISDIEAILALEPDLVLIHSFVDPRRVTRLREAGLTVFDFGSMRGLDHLLDDIRQLGTLLGHPERGDALVERFTSRLRGVAADVPATERPGAIYVAIHGVRLYGGTVGTSFHDVLRYAGLRDLAADDYVEWPAYTTEQLLALDPPNIVTREGMRLVLCTNSALVSLRACHEGGRVVELSGDLLNDAGLGILDATEAVHRAFYGSPREEAP